MMGDYVIIINAGQGCPYEEAGPEDIPPPGRPGGLTATAYRDLRRDASSVPSRRPLRACFLTTPRPRSSRSCTSTLARSTPLHGPASPVPLRIDPGSVTLVTERLWTLRRTVAETIVSSAELDEEVVPSSPGHVRRPSRPPPAPVVHRRPAGLGPQGEAAFAWSPAPASGPSTDAISRTTSPTKLHQQLVKSSSCSTLTAASTSSPASTPAAASPARRRCPAPGVPSTRSTATPNRPAPAGFLTRRPRHRAGAKAGLKKARKVS